MNYNEFRDAFRRKTDFESAFGRLTETTAKRLVDSTESSAAFRSAMMDTWRLCREQAERERAEENKPLSIYAPAALEPLSDSTCFLAFAGSGAMGYSGTVLWINRDGFSFFCDYIDGNVEFAQLEAVFPELKRIYALQTEEWVYVPLGMGNHLIVKETVYPRFVQELGECRGPAEAYRKWFRAAGRALR